jgi:hypothetical protein
MSEHWKTLRRVMVARRVAVSALVIVTRQSVSGTARHIRERKRRRDATGGSAQRLHRYSS